MITYVLRNAKESKPQSLIAYVKIPGHKPIRITTRFKVLPERWNPETQRIIKDRNVNHLLDKLYNQFEDHINKNRSLSTEQLKSDLKEIALYGEKKVKNQFFEILDDWIKSSSLTKSARTIKNYNTLRSRLVKFNDEYQLNFDLINKIFLDKYSEFLLSWPNPKYPDKKIIPYGDNWLIVSKDHPDRGEPIGLFDASIAKDISVIKTFMDWSSDREYHTNTVYHKLSYPDSPKLDNIILTESELDKLYRHQFDNESHSKVRDLACIEAYSGQRFSDVQGFLKENFDFDSGTWTLKPKKSRRFNKTLEIHLVGYAMHAHEILRRYNYEVPQMSDGGFNRKIKEVCKVVGINSETSIVRKAGNKYIIRKGPKWEFVTSHTFRRSAATILVNSGMPLNLVMEFFGWSKLSTADKYMLQDKSAVRKAMEQTALRIAK